MSEVVRRRRRALALVRFEAGEPDDLGPLLSFLVDEPAEVGGRPGEYVAAELAHARLYGRIDERRINLPIETLDDFWRRALGCPKAQEARHRVAGDDIGDRRNVGEHPQ